MGRANVYLPDDLERRVKAARIPISEVCQRALLAAVEAAEGDVPGFGEEISGQFRRGWEVGEHWAGSAGPELLLMLLRDQRLEHVPAEVLPADLYSLTRDQTLAWEAGFMEAARTATRRVLAMTQLPGDGGSDGVGQDPSPDSADDEGSATRAEPDAGPPPGPGTTGLGDDSGSRIGVTLDDERVSFDPHAAVRQGKSPLFAILGQADLRARLALTVAQDAAARGTAVLLVDLSGEFSSRTAGLGKNVRIIQSTQPAMPQLSELAGGAVSLGGLWEVLSGLSSSAGLAGLLGGQAEDLLEPGYVTILHRTGDGPLAATLSLMPVVQALARLATPAQFPRLLQVDLPSGLNIPAGVAGWLGRIIRVAREQNTAVGLSAESAESVTQVAGSGSLLSTVLAFATGNPVEADRLRRLLGPDAPILLNPPGRSSTTDDDAWAAMRDIHGRLGQVRIDAS
ncbi:MAG: hypothetical protein JWN47_1003 [Frankiales bacterium]|nr:hypothetical protein [Frankiales bacterium]